MKSDLSFIRAKISKVILLNFVSKPLSFFPNFPHTSKIIRIFAPPKRYYYHDISRTA